MGARDKAGSARVRSKDKKGIEERRPVRVMSMFSGCGGLDIGLIMAPHHALDFEVAWANDYVPSACDTYERNLHHDISREDVWRADFSRTPDCDVIVGGFPCQDFSQLGKRRGFGKEDGRGLLYTRIVDAIAEKRPLAFLCENVKGLATMNRRLAFKRILMDLRDACSPGYNIRWRIVNFADYGVPQTRERIIIVGLRNDLGARFRFPRPTHHGGGPVRLMSGSRVERWVTAGEALEGIHPAATNHETRSLSPLVMSRLRLVPPGGNYTAIPELARKRGYLSMDYLRFHSDKPAPTIIASFNVSRMGFHWSEDRNFTMREYARFQTFPDKWDCAGDDEAVKSQIGNAVPPVGIKPIAEALLEVLWDRHYSRK